jgi:hypothetical protein
MTFTSYKYIAFFTVAALAVLVVPRRWRVGTFLVANYAFYACWRLSYVPYLVGITLATYAAGLWFGRNGGKAVLVDSEVGVGSKDLISAIA